MTTKITDAPTVDGDIPTSPEESPVEPAIARRTARWLEMQGFSCATRPDAEALVPWLRFSPGLTTVVVVVGTALASPLLLGALSLVTGVCAATQRHPFDLVYDRVLRPVTGSPALPRNPVPRRFACGIATGWLVTTALAFLAGAALAGYALGALLVVLGTLVATTHLCVGSLVYQLLTGRLSERHAAP